MTFGGENGFNMKPVKHSRKQIDCQPDSPKNVRKQGGGHLHVIYECEN